MSLRRLLATHLPRVQQLGRIAPSICTDSSRKAEETGEVKEERRLKAISKDEFVKSHTAITICQDDYKDINVEDDLALSPDHEQPKVVIIGAGIAGLSVAEMLLTYGFRNITLLEALDRPGGRIHSLWMDNVVAELGAEWIEGASLANSIFVLACQEGLLRSPLCKHEAIRCINCTSKGIAVDFDICNKAYEIFQNIDSEARRWSLLEYRDEMKMNSLLDFLNLRIEQEMKNFSPVEQMYLECVFNGMIHELRCQYGEDLSRISLEMYGRRDIIPGGYVGLPFGFIATLASLARRIPEKCVWYSKPVNLIRWGTTESRPRALVQCSDGEQISADYVVITVSLGVLKKQNPCLFCPALPYGKVSAIKNIGFGTINKIFLKYKHPFWIRREGNIRLAWDRNDWSQRSDWVRGISRIEELRGTNHVLYSTISGREASLMENCTDAELIKDYTLLLRQFTGDSTIPCPECVLRSMWYSNPYFCGTHSYMSVDSSIEHQQFLMEPIPRPCANTIAPILLFAGEATSTGHFGTVHGARESGLREAVRIAKLTKLFRGPPHTTNYESDQDILNAHT